MVGETATKFCMVIKLDDQKIFMGWPCPLPRPKIFVICDQCFTGFARKWQVTVLLWNSVYTTAVLMNMKLCTKLNCYYLSYTHCQTSCLSLQLTYLFTAKHYLSFCGIQCSKITEVKHNLQYAAECTIITHMHKRYILF